jgi:sulfate/thiosulfate transport system permease protein
MRAPTRQRPDAATLKSRRGTEEPLLVKWTLIALALGFVLLFLLLPLMSVFVEAFRKGAGHYAESLADPDTWSSIRLTLLLTAFVVPLNAVFGLAAAWAVTKFRFRGKPLLLTLIDLPFAVSPVVVGVMLVVLFGAQGYCGPWLREHDLRIVFALPGMVLATLFVTFPFVARELVPLMQSQGSDQEEAALTLGASGWQTFWHVTLPSVKWGLFYGVILTSARSMGEFGAVFVVSGRVSGETETLPLRVEKLYSEYNAASAFAVASLLAVLALVTLALKSWSEWRQERDEHAAQTAIQDQSHEH